jgi:hypothetical protein
MHGVLARPAFTVDGRPYTWADVIAAARAWGDWARLERDAGTRVAAARESAPGEDDVRAEADRFRSARRLYSADDFEAWLARWDLDLDGWLAYVRRSLVSPSGGPPPVDVDHETVWTHAVCSGQLEELSRRLSERVAVYAGVEGEAPATDRLTEVDEVFDRFREQAATTAAVDSAIEQHRIDWTRLDCLWLESPSMDVASEIALSVREDGRALQAVAAEAGLPVERRSIALEDADHELAPHVLGARAGDLVGPVTQGRVFALALVVARIEPSVRDASSRLRAQQHVTKHAVEREVQRRVRRE